MGQVYDYLAVRRVASKVKSVAGSVSSMASSDINRLTRTISGNFVGEAADALAAELDELRNDLRSLSKGLSGVASDLYAYAARIKAIDEADS
jgi:uncharacterized protein YukE